MTAQASLILFEDSEFVENSCGKAGGAIGLVYRAAFDAYNCYFARNRAVTRGGVTSMIGTRQPIRLFNCTVEENTAEVVLALVSNTNSDCPSVTAPDGP